MKARTNDDIPKTRARISSLFILSSMYSINIAFKMDSSSRLKMTYGTILLLHTLKVKADTSSRVCNAAVPTLRLPQAQVQLER